MFLVYYQMCLQVSYILDEKKIVKDYSNHEKKHNYWFNSINNDTRSHHDI